MAARAQYTVAGVLSNQRLAGRPARGATVPALARSVEAVFHDSKQTAFNVAAAGRAVGGHCCRSSPSATNLTESELRYSVVPLRHHSSGTHVAPLRNHPLGNARARWRSSKAADSSVDTPGHCRRLPTSQEGQNRILRAAHVRSHLLHLEPIADSPTAKQRPCPAKKQAIRHRALKLDRP